MLLRSISSCTCPILNQNFVKFFGELPALEFKTCQSWQEFGIFFFSDELIFSVPTSRHWFPSEMPRVHFSAPRAIQ